MGCTGSKKSYKEERKIEFDFKPTKIGEVDEFFNTNAK